MTFGMPSYEGFIPFRGYRIWYCIVGDLSLTSVDSFPVLALHGGPGIPHESLQPLEQLALSGRAVIFYDQLGCGNSDRPDDLSLWDVPCFLEEIAMLRKTLYLERVHLFGHSWGGMLALEHALKEQKSLASLMLASVPAHVPAMFAEQQRIWEQLPSDILALLSVEGEKKAATHQQALAYFETHFYCRCDPWPDYLLQARTPEKRNTQLNQHMWNNVLYDWDIIPRLHMITLPTLITAGYHDGIAGGQDALLSEHIKSSQHIIFSECSHYAHAEQTELYLEALQKFMRQSEMN
ncbi:proline iminopeptidase-family hydrolase [Dictyobacter kobayashii]|uniref:Proline iminopeptidase n=1 Tax=Dictyobacter kobayashii TaxID=2014872 RepID=A0A402AVY9_9CHLR|nr:proline iminopeptidase-family hydrolase [Dictyobacter kobayashii]GCE23257.1 amino acid amidase [Dictyobacter kobayashii]